MNRFCLDVQSQLSTWMDGELEQGLIETVEQHLAGCAECRQVADSLRHLDAQLQTLSGSHKDAASRIAANALRAWDHEQSGFADGRQQANPVVAVEPASVIQDLHSALISDSRERVRLNSNADRGRGRFSVSLAAFGIPSIAAAAGFFLAWMMFAPESKQIAEIQKSNPQLAPTVEETRQARQPLPEIAPETLRQTARLVATTGRVEVRRSGQDAWSTVDNALQFDCAPGTEVRTVEGVRCELETTEKCTIRMNEATDLVVRSAHEIELRAGQVWCQSQSETDLQILAPAVPPKQPAANPFVCCVCPSNGVLIGEIDPMGNCRIQSASDDIAVRMGDSKQQLKRGEIARFEQGKLIIEPHHADALLATSWMQPLLVMKGRDNPELGDRVNRLLANLGRSKLENLYEDEIRGLGDFAALPLLRFVQSKSSQDIYQQRQRAMEILTDIAPTWIIGDLIELLADRDAQVRARAAETLLRLTGQTLGRSPNNWRDPLPELKDSLERWQIWWKQNSIRYQQRNPSGNTMREKNA